MARSVARLKPNRTLLGGAEGKGRSFRLLKLEARFKLQRISWNHHIRLDNENSPRILQQTYVIDAVSKHASLQEADLQNIEICSMKHPSITNL